MKNRRLLWTVAMLLVCCGAWSQTLFSSSERGAVGEVIAAHVDKVVAQLAAAPDEERAGQLATKHGVGIVIEGVQGVGARSAAKQLLSLCGKEHKFFLSKGDKNVDCRWAFSTGASIIVHTEISRENIEGTDKEQADSMVMSLISHLPSTTYTLPVPQEKALSHVSRTSVLELRGKRLMQTGLNGNTYYAKSKGEIKPVFSKKFPVETIHNIALNALRNDSYVLDITGDVYKGKSNTVRVKMKDFVAYWQQDGRFNLYCGAEPKTDGNGYEVVLVIEHKELQYLHMLRFDFTESLLDKPAVIKARLTPNIPQHNINSLF